jgi:hypothetical protein
MLDITSTVFSLIAIAVYLLSLFLLIVIMKRTRGKFKSSLVFWFISIIILIITRTLGLLSLYSLDIGEALRDGLVALASIFLIISIYTLFREIRSLTDVRLNHSREARRETSFPPPRRQPGEEFERQRERVEDKNVRVDGDGKRRLRVVNGYVDFTNE